MENKNLNPMLLQPPVEAVIKYSERKQQWNNRLVCKLWNQKVLEWGEKHDLRCSKKQVLVDPMLLTVINTFLNIKDRIALNSTCTSIHGKVKINAVYFADQDMEVLEDFIEKVKEAKKEGNVEKIKYYASHVNKLKLLAKAIPVAVFSHYIGKIYTLPYLITSNVMRTRQRLQENFECDLGNIKDIVGAHIPALGLDVTTLSLRLTESAMENLSQPGKLEPLTRATQMMRSINNQHTGFLKKFFQDHDGLIQRLFSLVGAGLTIYQFSELMDNLFGQEWNQLSQDFMNEITVPIPKDVLRKAGLSREDLPDLPVYCTCSVKYTLQEVTFSLTFEGVKGSDGGHVVSLDEAQRSIAAKQCNRTGKVVRSKHFVPLITILVSSQKSLLQKTKDTCQLF